MELVHRRPTVADLAREAARAAARQAARTAAERAREYMRRTDPPTQAYKRPKYAVVNYAGRRGRYRTLKREVYDRKEIKNLDDSRTASNAISANTAEVNLLNGIAQGDAENQRDGRVIKPLACIARFQYEPATGTAANLIRILLVHDKQPDGSTISYADVLNSATGYSLSNADLHYRFTVLHDSVWHCPVGESAVGQRYFKEIACDMKGCGPAYYSDNGATIASIIKGSCYYIIIPNVTIAANELNVNSRYSYVDV